VAAFGPGGLLAVAWSERAAGRRATHLMARASTDGGLTFGTPARVNDDAAWDTTGSHGFPAIAFRPDGSLFVAWLEDRIPNPSDARAWWPWWNRRAALGLKPRGTGEPSAHTLMAAVSADGGRSWGPNFAIADSACDCCRPEVRAGGSGLLAVAYRRAEGGLRDPALAIVGGPGAITDTLLSSDGWRFDGCPVQGPDLTWTGDTGGLYAWYTAAGDTGVYVIPWRHDHGAAGLKRRLADSLVAAHHPRLVPLGARTLIAVEARPPDGPERSVVAVRAIAESGALTPWSFLGADAESAWLAPLDARTALACWVERAEGGRVRLARLQVRE